MIADHSSINIHHNSEGENSKDFEVDPMVVNSYATAFGTRNRDKIMMLLYAYPGRFDRGNESDIAKKVATLKKTGLTVRQILDICASNIKVISSREDKYWRKVELLIELGVPANLLYEMLSLRPKKWELNMAIKAILPKYSKSR